MDIILDFEEEVGEWSCLICIYFIGLDFIILLFWVFYFVIIIVGELFLMVWNIVISSKVMV